MNESVQRILGEVEGAPTGTSSQWREFSERDEFSSESFVRGIDPLRKFLGAPPDVGGRRPGGSFYAALLGHGREAAVLLLTAFAESAAPDDPAEAGRTWRAAASAVRIANREGLTSWNLNTWRPPSHDPLKRRLVAYLPGSMHAEARAAAFERGESLSGFVAAALTEKLERLQREEKRKPAQASA